MERKRKRPSFVHLPAAQAAKKKQVWVHNAKIRSKWAKERKKLENEMRPHQGSIGEELGSEEKEEDEESEGEENEARERQEIEGEEHPRKKPKLLPASAQSLREGGYRAEPVPKEERTLFMTERPHMTMRKEARRSTGREGLVEKQRLREEKQRVRELMKKAYSKDTLHSYKSDPLGRRKGHLGSGSTESRRGGDKGQPNMKLRMNALLEKIKLDIGT